MATSLLTLLELSAHLAWLLLGLVLTGVFLVAWLVLFVAILALCCRR